jgi:hypothetical protein
MDRKQAKRPKGTFLLFETDSSVEQQETINRRPRPSDGTAPGNSGLPRLRLWNNESGGNCGYKRLAAQGCP